MFRNHNWRDVAMTAAAILVCWVRLAHHEVWRDEINVWGIALASRTLADLFHKVHYEGHPSLWYVLLWCVSRFTSNFGAMKVVQGAIAGGIYITLGLYSPFSRLERALLFCSYYVFFEYTILSRTYGLCFLVLLVFLVLRFRRPERTTINLIVLGVLANTEVLGFMLACLLCCEYMWEYRDRVRRFAPGGALFMTAVVACCLSVVPAHDLSYRTAGRQILGHVSQTVMFLGALVANVVLPWFPLKISYPRPYWNAVPGDSMFYLAAVPAMLAAYWLVLRGHGRLMLLTAGAILGSTCFSFLIYFGSVRNFGIVFLALLFALWSMREKGFRMPGMAMVLLSISAVQGLAAGIAEYHHPFSNAGATARWLAEHHYADAQLVGTPDTSLAGVAEQLGKPAYFLDCNCSDTYLAFSSRRDQFSYRLLPVRIVQAARLFAGAKTVMIFSDPLDQPMLQDMERQGVVLAPVAAFTGAEAWQEDFYIYTVRPADLASAQ